jgi:hypothetical protein
MPGMVAQANFEYIAGPRLKMKIKPKQIYIQTKNKTLEHRMNTGIYFRRKFVQMPNSFTTQKMNTYTYSTSLSKHFKKHKVLN